MSRRTNHFQALFDHNQVSVIFSIFTMLDIPSLHKCRQVSSQWSDFIIQEIWGTRHGREKLVRKLISSWSRKKTCELARIKMDSFFLTLDCLKLDSDYLYCSNGGSLVRAYNLETLNLQIQLDISLIGKRKRKKLRIGRMSSGSTVLMCVCHEAKEEFAPSSLGSRVYIFDKNNAFDFIKSVGFDEVPGKPGGVCMSEDILVLNRYDNHELKTAIRMWNFAKSTNVQESHLEGESHNMIYSRGFVASDSHLGKSVSLYRKPTGSNKWTMDRLVYRTRVDETAVRLVDFKYPSVCLSLTDSIMDCCRSSVLVVHAETGAVCRFGDFEHSPRMKLLSGTAGLLASEVHQMEFCRVMLYHCFPTKKSNNSAKPSRVDAADGRDGTEEPTRVCTLVNCDIDCVDAFRYISLHGLSKLLVVNQLDLEL